MFSKKITIIFYRDRGIPKMHVICENGKVASGKIEPIFQNGKVAKCLYCDALGWCPND